MDKNKLILPISILLGCIILGSFIYVSQVSKQQSIEKLQHIELQAKIDSERAKAVKDDEETIFSNNLKCQSLLKELQRKWNNVVGIYYSEEQNTCIVKYSEDGDTLEGPLETMQNN